MDVLRDLFLDHTVRTVALGAALVGIVAGALGTFAVLRRQSLLGDAMSHAALPGIALGFLLTQSKEPIVLLAGAALAGWVGTFLVTAIVRTTRVKYDAALGIVLSVFFGVGLVLLTLLQRRPDASQAGLDTFLFGQAAALLERDVVTMAVLGAVVLGVTAALWKELKLLTFDPDFAATLGFRVRALDALLTGLLVVAIAVGLQTVGVVLMAAMVVAPAAAARQWTDRLGVMTVLAGGFRRARGSRGRGRLQRGGALADGADDRALRRRVGGAVVSVRATARPRRAGGPRAAAGGADCGWTRFSPTSTSSAAGTRASSTRTRPTCWRRQRATAPASAARWRSWSDAGGRGEAEPTGRSPTPGASEAERRRAVRERVL